MNATGKLVSTNQPKVGYTHKAKWPNTKLVTSVIYQGTQNGFHQIQVNRGGKTKFHDATLTRSEAGETFFTISREL